jgi:hypothetical protein
MEDLMEDLKQGIDDLIDKDPAPPPADADPESPDEKLKKFKEMHRYEDPFKPIGGNIMKESRGKPDDPNKRNPPPETDKDGKPGPPPSTSPAGPETPRQFVAWLSQFLEPGPVTELALRAVGLALSQGTVRQPVPHEATDDPMVHPPAIGHGSLVLLPETPRAVGISDQVGPVQDPRPFVTDPSPSDDPQAEPAPRPSIAPFEPLGHGSGPAVTSFPGAGENVPLRVGTE